jgi:hypothetical protein
MPDENQEAIEQEEAAQAVPPAESSDAQEKEKAQAFAAKSDKNDKDWRETRRKIDGLERKTREQEELIQRLSQAKAAPVDDEIERLGDDDIVTKGQARKLAAKMAEEIAQKFIKQRDNSMVDERLSMKYQDFTQVVTQENIEYLKETEPELAISLSYISDPYSQGVAAYKMLKKIGNPQEAENMAQINRDKEKAVKNSQKPVSVQAVAKQSPIGNAQLFENGLTADTKKRLWKEMQEAIKGF